MQTLFASTKSSGQPKPDLLEQLVKAREEHVRDLRILLDKSAEREHELAGMVRMVMEERFYRPAVTREGGTQRKQPPILPMEALNDVSTFDEGADRERLKEGDDLTREIESGFSQLMNEHNRAREAKTET